MGMEIREVEYIIIYEYLWGYEHIIDRLYLVGCIEAMESGRMENVLNGEWSGKPMELAIGLHQFESVGMFPELVSTGWGNPYSRWVFFVDADFMFVLLARDDSRDGEPEYLLHKRYF